MKPTVRLWYRSRCPYTDRRSRAGARPSRRGCQDRAVAGRAPRQCVERHSVTVPRSWPNVLPASAAPRLQCALVVLHAVRTQTDGSKATTLPLLLAGRPDTLERSASLAGEVVQLAGVAMRARPPSGVRRPRTAARGAPLEDVPPRPTRRSAPGWTACSGDDGPPTEHGRLEREQDTLSLIGFGCPELRVLPVRRQGLEPRTVALRERHGRSPDLWRNVVNSCLPGHLLAAAIRS